MNGIADSFGFAEADETRTSSVTDTGHRVKVESIVLLSYESTPRAREGQKTWILSNAKRLLSLAPFLALISTYNFGLSYNVNRNTSRA